LPTLIGDCAIAECPAGQRIVGCNGVNVDVNTPQFSLVALRDPEDDTADNVLSRDTCFACFTNFSDATVNVAARAICIPQSGVSAITADEMVGRGSRSGLATLRALRPSLVP
jgi:hypothetical protein